ncbi:MAG: hypothetical protein Kow0042_31400 [Calditrichia bacterium]
MLESLKKFNEKHPFYLTSQEQDSFRFKYIPANSWEDKYWYYSPIRTSQPLKSFFYPPQQKVATYPPENGENQDAPLVIIGPKACDIHALKIIDKVYAEGQYPDNHYLQARKNVIIISTDCLEAGPHCYCTLMNYQPYPKSDFDLNLSKLDGKFLLEIGSDKGKKILDGFFVGLEEAPDSIILEREKRREKLTEQIAKQNEEFRYFKSHRESIEKHLDSQIWEELAKTCVECGTCTQICPTCHCFLLYDVPREERFDRIRIWDSCFFAGYSRMAGGLTPRLALADRFKNRFYHKFDSFVTNFGVEACTGCGRCVEGCMGKIDLREVLLELERRVVLREHIDLL